MSKFEKIERTLWVNLPLMLKTAAVQYTPGLVSNKKTGTAPFMAAINITDKCNLRCIACNQWRTPHPGEFKKEDWIDVIKQLKEVGVRDINYAGGEPLMVKGLLDIMKYSKSIGISTGMISNGFLLNEEKIVQLIDAGLINITLSMDALGDEHDTIRGYKGSFDKLVENLKILAKYRDKKMVEVNIAYLLMKDTLEHYEGVMNIAQELKVPVVVNLFDTTPYFFQMEGDDTTATSWFDESQKKKMKKFQEYMVKKKEINKDFTYHSYAEIDYMEKYFEDSLQKNMPCAISQKRICIGPKGQVYGGCWSMGVFGDLKKQSLKEIINSEHYRTTHRKMYAKQCPGCSCGYSSNVRYSLPYRLKDLRYKMVGSSRKEIYQSK